MPSQAPAPDTLARATTTSDTNRSSVLPAVGAVEKKRSWLRNEHPYYAANKDRWVYVRDHYEGAVVDPKLVEKYLIRRSAGESKGAFEERAKLADYTNHLAEAVESLVGMLTAVEGDANRAFTREGVRNGLGEPDDPATPIGALWRRANGAGEGYLTVWKKLGIDLALYHFGWVMVDGTGTGARVRVLGALDVQNWLDDGSAVLIRESFDSRTSLQETAETVDQWIFCTPQGWQRWREDRAGNPVALVGEGNEGTWSYESPERQAALPIFPVALPMKRPVGYQLAKKANAIFNKESERDHLLRVANFPRLVLRAGNTLYDTIVDRLNEGSNVLQEEADGAGGHRYIAPETSSATAASETLKAKIADFQKTAHKAYDDGTGSQRTATEVRQDVASGTGAFLQLLKAGLDDAENGALWRVEQTLFPQDRAKWFIAHVERSDDFLPADPDAVAEKTAAAAFGKDRSVPLGLKGRVAAAKAMASQRGLEVDDAELAADVAAQSLIALLESAPTSGLQLPASVRVALTLQVLAANGFTPAEDVALEDGTKVSGAAALSKELLDLYKAADEQKKRDAEALGLGSGGTGADPDEDDDPELPA